MKKRFLLFMMVIALGTTILSAPAMALGPDYEYLKMVNLTIDEKAASVNGNIVPLDQPAFTKNGRTLVPLRFLAEALGADVNWNSNTSTAALTLESREVQVTLGSRTAYINGQASTLDVPAENKGGRTFVPLRFISEALGAAVRYDASTQAISISLIDTTGWNTLEFPAGGSFIYPADWVLEGDFTDGFIITSPAESELFLMPYVSGEYPSVDDFKETFLYQGFELISTIPINNLDGKAELYALLDPEDTYNSDVIVLALVNIKGSPFIFDFSSKFPNCDADLAVLEKMFEELK